MTSQRQTARGMDRATHTARQAWTEIQIDCQLFTKIQYIVWTCRCVKNTHMMLLYEILHVPILCVRILSLYSTQWFSHTCFGGNIIAVWIMFTSNIFSVDKMRLHVPLRIWRGVDISNRTLTLESRLHVLYPVSWGYKNILDKHRQSKHILYHVTFLKVIKDHTSSITLTKCFLHRHKNIIMPAQVDIVLKEEGKRNVVTEHFAVMFSMNIFKIGSKFIKSGSSFCW